MYRLFLPPLFQTKIFQWKIRVLARNVWQILGTKNVQVVADDATRILWIDTVANGKETKDGSDNLTNKAHP